MVRSKVLGLAGHLFGTFVELHYSHCLLVFLEIAVLPVQFIINIHMIFVDFSTILLLGGTTVWYIIADRVVSEFRRFSVWHPFYVLMVNSQFGELFLLARGYSDAFFFVGISLSMALTLVYVIVLYPESRTALTIEVSSHTQETLSFKTSPILSARRLIFNLASPLLLPISMFAPRAIP